MKVDMNLAINEDWEMGSWRLQGGESSVGVRSVLKGRVRTIFISLSVQ